MVLLSTTRFKALCAARRIRMLIQLYVEIQSIHSKHRQPTLFKQPLLLCERSKMLNLSYYFAHIKQVRFPIRSDDSESLQMALQHYTMFQIRVEGRTKILAHKTNTSYSLQFLGEYVNVNCSNDSYLCST